MQVLRNVDKDLMTKRSVIQPYINNFRRHLSPFIRPGIGVRCDIREAVAGGTVLVFTLGPTIESDDKYHDPLPTIGKALGEIEQKAFVGNLDGLMFSGTNTILEENRLIFIKDDASSVWNDAAALADVQRVVQPKRKVG